MTHGSLFSGIGGFDLAAEWMGWENVFHCEWNPFGRRVLKHHFPKAISYEDITNVSFRSHRGTIDILTGGFPCQPYSVAGSRLGKDDERHLWPHMLRAVREIKPRWVVGENVRGIISWNDGLVFDEVCSDLEAEGYQVQPFLLPACGVNAPHQRFRVWFVAHTNDRQCEHEDKEVCSRGATPIDGSSDATHTDSNQRPEGRGDSNRPQEAEAYVSQRNARRPRSTWKDFPSQPPICGGDDGLPTELDGITFSKWRKESIKAYGNAIVPQVAHQIFKAIEKQNEQQI